MIVEMREPSQPRNWEERLRQRTVKLSRQLCRKVHLSHPEVVAFSFKGYHVNYKVTFIEQRLPSWALVIQTMRHYVT